MFIEPNKMLLKTFTGLVIYKDEVGRLYRNRDGGTTRWMFYKAECGRLYRNRDGATAIEYGLIAAGVAVAIAALTVTLGTELQATFKKIIAGLKAG